ncbi:hypothetical protein LTS08_005379 [Lithohypha guttulata]|uniref:Uncharacterized protein n=1 Tax=Lithohypha guttulata TaxID=1690604 RepID=A0AAN7T6X5_9EURO|nr:hypothetical protein LTR51_008293 [Lithohypha guttulata]KAK5091618.1 hypothetical protein LTR05_001803 [Lithohypha guttulata]KAK5100628.1 hypothetical protein LTS08_005379 [Lithohypha guttulata]
MPINQPANQIKLTNVSLVRYKKGKKRFELACYKNKLLEYRSGNETDLDNVLQIPTIFLNASKGETAPNAELLKAWPQLAEEQESSHTASKSKGGKKGGKKAQADNDAEKTWKDAIIEEILKKGEIQVNANERKELLDRMEREIVEEVAQRLVDPQTKRVYTTGMIKKGLDVLSKQGGHAPAADSLPHKLGKLNLEEYPKKGGSISKESQNTSGVGTPNTDAGEAEGEHSSKGREKKGDLPMWTGVVTSKSVKQQALDAIRALIAWQPIPVMRARMRLRITCPTSLAKQAARSKASTEGSADNSEGKGTIQDRLLSFVEDVESQDVVGEEWEVIGFVEPGAFKDLGEFCSAETKGLGKVEILDMAVVHSDD